MKVEGNIVDIHRRRIYGGVIEIKDGIISGFEKKIKVKDQYIMPGLIDAHIHIESSMATPGSFARTAVSRGTTGVLSDPHEIANVLGIEGVLYMIKDAGKVPLKFWFGAPSCVPATLFESAGATLDSESVRKLLERKDIFYLAEMMNFPGVIYRDKEVLRKLDFAKTLKKPIDGHAPGLTGESLERYVSAGITTDHECATLEEAKEKIKLGMKILIREGSAARNLDALKGLISSNPDMVMLCSDDLHPEMLIKRHIGKIVADLVKEGFDLFDVVRCCSLNPVRHYGINGGTLKAGDPADFIIVDDPREMGIIETWIDGKKVFDRGEVLFDYTCGDKLNRFNCTPVNQSDIEVRREGKTIRVIEAFDGELLTKEIIMNMEGRGPLKSDTERDVLKIVVKDRYNNSAPATGFIKGFNLKIGAFASSVAHDSHNIICVGTNDRDIVSAINEIIRIKGGLAVASEDHILSLELPVAGIMSGEPVDKTAGKYQELSEIVKRYGCRLFSPFMTLSFMALLVIPEIKLSDKGLFDGKLFRHIPLFTD
jgi:adenine deaminase